MDLVTGNFLLGVVILLSDLSSDIEPLGLFQPKLIGQAVFCSNKEYTIDHRPSLGLSNLYWCFTRNSHVWDRDNLHGTVERKYQHPFSINVWYGFIDDQLIGRYIFPYRLTGDIYSNFTR